MNETDAFIWEPTSTSRKILYGMPRIGSSLVLGVEGIALFTLYVTAYNVDEFLVGFALMMGYFSIAIAQFLLGWLSDAKYTRLGRRKPYLFVFGPLLGISFIFLLMPGLVLPDMNDTNALFFWLLIWDIIFRASYAVTTPYQAWMTEIFPTHERPRVSQIQNTYNFIGNGLMAVMVLLVFTNAFDAIILDPSIIPLDFMIIVLAFGIVAIVLFLLIAIFIPTEPYHKIKINLWKSLVTTVKNKNFMLVVLMQGISGFAWSIISTVMLTYTETVLSLGTLEYIVVAVCLLLSIFVFLYFWRKRIEKRGKKKTLLIVFVIGIFFLPITLLGLIEQIPPLLIGVVFIVGIGMILGGWYLFPYIMYADLAEDDEKSTGDLRAGIYTGFPSIILNIFQGFGVFLLGIITSLPVIVARGTYFSLGYVLWGPICAAILLISYIYTRTWVQLDFNWEKDKT